MSAQIYTFEAGKCQASSSIFPESEIKFPETSRTKAKDKDLISALELTSLHQIQSGVVNLDLADGLLPKAIDELPDVCSDIRSR